MLFLNIEYKRIIYQLQKIRNFNSFHLFYKDIIDARWYEDNDGSIHCATKTIRDPERVFTFK